MRRATPGLLPPLLAPACAVSPEPPSPDPTAGGVRREGRPEGAGPAQFAFCVSQEVQPSLVVLPPDGAAVRPVRADGGPDYAPTLHRAEGGVAWVRQVAEAEPAAAAAAVADRLDRALDVCANRRSDGA